MIRRTLPYRPAIHGPLRAAGFAMVVLLAVSIYAVGTASAQTTPVELTLQVESEAITVGDPFTITLSVAHPPDYHIVFPRLESEWGEFEVRNQISVPTADNGDGTLTSSIEIEAVLFETGDHPTPELSVAVRKPDGTIIYRPARPIDVTVQTVRGRNDDDNNELKDIRPQVELPVPPDPMWVARDRNRLAILGAASGIGLAILAIYLWRRRLVPTMPGPGSPAEVALRELDRIAALGLESDSDFKERYTLVSECLRIYLHDQFGVPAMELTTRQIARTLDPSDISESAARDLAGALDECDLVKFARFLPDAQDARDIISRSREFVRETGAPPPVDQAAVPVGGETA